MDEFGPTPAAEEIERRRRDRRLSIREAAKRAELSEGRWRQIAKGYQQVAQGVRVPVTVPASTLARMANAVGITSDELVAVGEREVADIVREIAASKLRHPSRRNGDRVPSALELVPTDELLSEVARRLIAGERAQAAITELKIEQFRQETTDAPRYPAPSTHAGGSPAPDVSVGDYTLAASDDEDAAREFESHEDQP